MSGLVQMVESPDRSNIKLFWKGVLHLKSYHIWLDYPEAA